MSETPTTQQPIILATISPTEAAQLHDLEITDPVSLQLREKMGALSIGGGERAFALIVDTDEQGNEVPTT